MNAWWRGLFAFSISSLGVALAFWGVVQGAKFHHLLSLLAVLPGALLLTYAFRVAPNNEP